MIAENVSNDEKRQALELVFRSHMFARSDRLRSLLRFLCEAEIEGRQDNLNEYLIGVEALGRPEGYSPTEDSSVRSRAYELRQRLERFYATEAPDAPLRIDVPKGSYIPRFVRFSVPPAPVSPVPVPEPQVPHGLVTEDVPQPGTPRNANVRRAYWRLAAAFVAGAVVMYGVTAFREGLAVGEPQARSNAESSRWTPELEAIWQPFLDPKTPLLVSFQTRLFFAVGPISVRDVNVDSLGTMESSQSLMRVKELFAVPQVYENRNYTDFGAANACLLLARLLGSRQPAMVAKRSSDVHWEDLRNNNVIILGKPAADPDVARLLPKDHFLEVGGNIRNLRPMPGEMTSWEDHAHPSDPSKNWTEKYALVTMMPGPQPGRWILSMAGSGSEHPWAMARFLTSPESARDLVARLREPSGRVPSSSQVVIRADLKAQAPVQVSYVTHRSLETRSRE